MFRIMVPPFLHASNACAGAIDEGIDGIEQKLRGKLLGDSGHIVRQAVWNARPDMQNLNRRIGDTDPPTSPSTPMPVP